MAQESRNLWRVVINNFFKSLMPRQIKGNPIGRDYIGNKYFEIPANPSIGKRKASRWYDPAPGLDFRDPIPSEWESWLRMRRAVPPTEEEIAQNLAIAQMKKDNAAKLEEKRLSEKGALPSLPSGPAPFPTYSDLPPGDPENPDVPRSK